MNWLKIALSMELEEGQKKRFFVEGKAILACRVGGKLYATSDICTHATASLSAGCLKGFEIECPLHGARFDVRTGEVRALPAAIPVKVFQIKEENDEIFILI